MNADLPTLGAPQTTIHGETGSTFGSRFRVSRASLNQVREGPTCRMMDEIRP